MKRGQKKCQFCFKAFSKNYLSTHQKQCVGRDFEDDPFRNKVDVTVLKDFEVRCKCNMVLLKRNMKRHLERNKCLEKEKLDPKTTDPNEGIIIEKYIQKKEKNESKSICRYCRKRFKFSNYKEKEHRKVCNGLKVLEKYKKVYADKYWDKQHYFSRLEYLKLKKRYEAEHAEEIAERKKWEEEKRIREAEEERIRKEKEEIERIEKERKREERDRRAKEIGEYLLSKPAKPYLECLSDYSSVTGSKPRWYYHYYPTPEECRPPAGVCVVGREDPNACPLNRLRKMLYGKTYSFA